MDKLKSVLSHGSKKGAHGEGRHLHDSNVKPNPSTSAEAGEQHHPIYDQFAKTKTTAPTDMTTPAPQSQAAPSDVQGEPGIRPNAPYGVPPHHVDETSTASVKSGVMGLPQGKTYQEAGQTQSGALPPSRLHHQKGYDDLNSQATTTSRSGAAALGHGQPFDQSSPGVITDTNREFPLAGGVTYRHDAEARPNPAGTGSTSTEEVANEGKSQGGLAGAAAAITAVAATAATTARSAAASAFSTAQPRSDSQDQAARQHDQEARWRPLKVRC
ncbi:hypothetical protein M011DRAFT_200642 [Sporormia fimetaria CBS 119925]|uniref:Uncharacterized protein n=1 Tax=Sporormia fimetaria CBS 119925 TaxID=1340428 RepID=A0A6A6V1Q7_9PLEO|nr:hypothetical protein M011DRAFT_200642 [Sporormia fimetaria CBS 119925]